MHLSTRIARRYFFSKNKKTFISLIANISMLGVGVGAMALVIVLSVFNGLEDFNRQLFRTFDADLNVSPRQGKTFALDKAVFEQVRRHHQQPGHRQSANDARQLGPGPRRLRHRGA